MTSATVPSNRARLVSTEFDNTAQYCFQYSYRRLGTGQGTLSIFRQTFANSTTPYLLIKHESTDFTDEWQVNQITLDPYMNQTTNIYRLLFEAISVNGIGRLMLDDLKMINGRCPALPNNCSIRCDTSTGTNQCIPTSQICDFNSDCVNNDDERSCGYNCDFELTQCNYTDPSAGLYKWQHQRAGAAIPGANSGPTFDHTTFSSYGYYMIVSINNGTIDERAHLVSPLLQQSSSTCELMFYYHMSGINVGRLEVLLIEGTETSRLWFKEGTQGDRWHRAIVRIGRLYRPFQVRFDAKKTATAFADITIDDIQWMGCNLPLVNNTITCKPNQFQCKRGGCIDQNRVCDYTDDCGDMSDEDNSTCYRPNVMPGCNFETDLCRFANLYGTELQFERTHAFHLINDYAPERDHTLNNLAGSFLSVNTFNTLPDFKAQMRSSRYIPTTGCRVRFYYYINSATSAGQLTFMIRTESAGRMTIVWSTAKVLGDYWERQEVLLPTGLMSELVIEVKSSAVGGGGFIGLDDISFSSECENSNGFLPFGTTIAPNGTQSTPGACTYSCRDGTCVGQEKRCNFIMDCSEGEDEIDCGDCDFEKSTCGWQDDSIGYYAWARRNASSILFMPGDMTTNTSSGFVMNVAAGSGSFAGSSRLVSERIASTAASCRVIFGAYRFYDRDGILALYLEDDSKYSTRLWTDPQTISSQSWTPTTVGVGRRDDGFRLVFTSTHIGTLVGSDLSIDDFKFQNCSMQQMGHCEGFTDQFNCSNGNCIHQDNVCDYSDDCGDRSDEVTCQRYVEMCDFENNGHPVCSWSHDESADFKWRRVQGEEINDGDRYKNILQTYGPDRDHTLGTAKGHFLFLDTSSPRKPNDTARVVSPVFASTTSKECHLRFWYHMYGSDVGALNVYTRNYIGGPLTKIWSQNGEKGDEWLRAKVVLEVTESFQLLIEGVRGPNYQGDIGVDDISFTPACQLLTPVTLPPFISSTTQSPYCNSTHSHCANNTSQCIPKDQFCNFNEECSDRSDESSCPQTCTFEGQTLCQWTIDRSQKLAWNYGSGSTSTPDTGPSVDHTTNSTLGTYIYLETSEGIYGDRARLISPLYRRSSKTCTFTFWYHMFGDTVDSLNIYIRAGGIDTLIWSLQGDHGDKWLQGKAYLPKCASEFSIIAEGVRGASHTGDIALDDFHFEQCYEDPPSPTCAQTTGDPNQFTCRSRHCIPKANTCDYELDCCDGSDEDEFQCYDYQRCDFERDNCLWDVSVDSPLPWERYRADVLPYQQRPPYDHTTRSQRGYYNLLRVNSTIPRGTLATVSNFLGETKEQGCTLRFWIYFKGNNNGQLFVGYRYAVDHNITNLPISTYQSCLTNTTVCSWQRIDVSLSTILTRTTEILIGVTTGADRDGIMALDDITFTPQCVKYNGTRPTRPPTTPYTGPSTTTTTTVTTPSECAGYCQNDGVCTISTTGDGKPTCQCKPGFHGERCENQDPKSSSNLGGILGGVFGALALIALIIVGYIFILPKIRRARLLQADRDAGLVLNMSPVFNPAYSSDA